MHNDRSARETKMYNRVDQAVLNFLYRAGLAPEDSMPTFMPLTGGVASDIWKVSVNERTFVLKRALPQLRVQQVWKAPISRNANEVQWMLEAQRVVPDSVPKVLAQDPKLSLFAMTFLDPESHPVWKQELQAGHIDDVFAGEVGRTISAIHSSTAGSPSVVSRFSTDDVFYSLRIEPYLEATARVHPDLSDALEQLVSSMMSNKRALVHGDISPKNILVGPSGPVFLDAECAWYGDPAFDFAFCLNHILLKTISQRGDRRALMESFEALMGRYLMGVTWEPPGELEARAARLLPALLLARIDGKSPVEYITGTADKELVRSVARTLIATPQSRLSEIRRRWSQEIQL
jgi:aminoglycoside phosphotransferase (APT) family kinase protein